MKTLILVSLVLLVSCANNTVPVPVQVANDINVLAQSTDAAVNAAIAAKNAGKISQGEFDLIGQVAVGIATAGKQINAELRTTDDWTTQKTKIIQILINSGVSNANAHLSSNAQAILAASIAAFNAISSAVGGPVI